MEGEGIIEGRAYGRVGLLGNPSDAYFGHTIAFALANFHASVSLRFPSPSIRFLPHPHHDLIQFQSLEHMVKRIEDEGYYGGMRLLMSICKVFCKYCSTHKIHLHSGNFSLSYDTNIPRQSSGFMDSSICEAGLSGSSAIVCATLSCLLEFYKVEHLVKVEDRPRIILSAEEEIGITAGLQDRVAQVYGGLVYMDFNEGHMGRTGNGFYTPMDPQLLPSLYVIYAENPSDSGKVHSTVRKRWLEGDAEIRLLMAEVAALAVQGKDALLKQDFLTLAELMDRNFDLRRRMFGDEVLGEVNIKMVEVARSVGAACKFTGSGGAVVAYCPLGITQEKQLETACTKAGFAIQRAIVAPAFVSHHI